MKKYRLGHLVGFLIIYFGITSGSSTAMMISLNVERLTDASDAVVMGQVTDKKTLWSADGSVIITRVTLAVQSTVRGVVNRSSIVVERLGGEVGEIGMRQTDQPEFIIGEHVLLFIKQTPSKVASTDRFAYRVVGAAQGKYSITASGGAVRTGFNLVSGAVDPDDSLPVEVLLDRIRTRANGR